MVSGQCAHDDPGMFAICVFDWVGFFLAFLFLFMTSLLVVKLCLHFSWFELLYNVTLQPSNISSSSSIVLSVQVIRFSVWDKDPTTSELIGEHYFDYCMIMFIMMYGWSNSYKIIVVGVRLLSCCSFRFGFSTIIIVLFTPNLFTHSNFSYHRPSNGEIQPP